MAKIPEKIQTEGPRYDPELMQALRDHKSILSLLGDDFSSTGSPFMDHIMIFGTFYQKKMIDRSDRVEIQNMGRRAIKLFFVALIMTGASNRLLTKLKFRKFDFLNLRLFLRLPVRLFITGACFWFCFLTPMANHLFYNVDKLNEKYYSRFELFKNSGDPLIMNPGLLEEPDFTEEERANTIQFVENVRMQNKQAQMQGRMM